MTFLHHFSGHHLVVIVVFLIYVVYIVDFSGLISWSFGHSFLDHGVLGLRLEERYLGMNVGRR